MRISIYCSERNIYGGASYLFADNKKIYRYDGSIDWQDLNKATFMARHIDMDREGVKVFDVYDRIVPVYEKSDVIFYDNNFPSAGRVALKVANSDVTPFVFNDIYELEDMLKDANYL